MCQMVIGLTAQKSTYSTILQSSEAMMLLAF